MITIHKRASLFNDVIFSELYDNLILHDGSIINDKCRFW